MRIDPSDTTETPTPDPADAAAELSAAMDAGIAAASPEAEAPIVETPAAPVPGSPEALAAEQKAADEAKPAEGAKAPDPADKAPEPDADTEKEIGELKLKDKAAARFRELTAEVKALAPLKAELDKAGITDIAQLPEIMRQAKDGTDLIDMVQSTKATADQFGSTLNYLSLVNKGDPDSLEQAYAALSGELADLAKLIGKEVAGVYDPLAEHQDLQDEIEAGDITRKRALEIASSRKREKIVEVRANTERQTSEQTAAQQQAQTEGVTALRTWEAARIAENPNYMAIREALSAKVTDIRKEYPPSKWVAVTQLAYEALAAKAAVPPPVVPDKKPPPGPMRPGAHRGTNLGPAVYDNPEDAMEAGIAAASG